MKLSENANGNGTAETKQSLPCGISHSVKLSDVHDNKMKRMNFENAISVVHCRWFPDVRRFGVAFYGFCMARCFSYSLCHSMLLFFTLKLTATSITMFAFIFILYLYTHQLIGNGNAFVLLSSVVATASRTFFFFMPSKPAHSKCYTKHAKKRKTTITAMYHPP